MNSPTPELLTHPRLLPKNSTILLWKSKTLPNSFTLKINEQRLVGLVRIDCQGESYWKFKEAWESGKNLPKQPALLKEPKPANEPINPNRPNS